MEALSPRDANVPIRKQPLPKSKLAPTKVASKEKDHPPPPPPEVLEPPSFDRKHGAVYQTGTMLGKGGFAICYEGRHTETKQLFALKIVKSQMPQKKMEQKFQTELQIHSKMAHPNIVKFFRAFSFQKSTYIILELCPNGSLMDMVKKRKYVTEPEVRFWTVQMAGAIKYMHAKGIIHRDLKMGNIFLDSEMNVKIGDFGLAALFMSDKDWSACRRTTLCGTPNYIAPEILSKEKQGHDQAVDIWSLGIIIFAMLTGKPPFQSTTADEIYRKAREREYDWPKLDTSENHISQETKDLVAELLQPAEQRPNPDTIVQHPFFTCGWVPQPDEMVPELRNQHPTADRFRSVVLRGPRTALYLKNLKKLCVTCEVGPWHAPKKTLISTYREVAAEEKAGLTPAVPLPEGVVYRRFDDWKDEQARKLVETDDEAPPALVMPMARPSSSRPRMTEREQPVLNTRPSAQSYAAQQRARPQGSGVAGSVKATLVPEKLENNPRPLANFPVRQRSASGKSVKVSQVTADVEDRLAADLVNQLGKPKHAKPAPVTPVEVAATTLTSPPSIFHPKEQLDNLPNSTPDNILNGLRRFLVEVDRALKSNVIATQPKIQYQSPPVVVKWVDYTNKFGLGYILSNSNVGCVTRSLPAHPSDPTQGEVPSGMLMIRDSEHHVRSAKNEKYPDRFQIVPINGPNIEFYESRGNKGIFRGTVNPQNYKVNVDGEGKAVKLSRGVDRWDDRKRERIVVWKKFANYMTTFGRDQEYPNDESTIRPVDEKKKESMMAGNFVIFYQRFGDVGVWVFYEGHIQFNFPDHTKVVISADGVWCDFYHLPLEAARDLKEKGTLKSRALDDRQRLSYPLETLLNFSKATTFKTTARRRPAIDPSVKDIPDVNQFRLKVEFIKDVVTEWVSHGGIGNSDMTPERRLQWMGYRETVNVDKKYKHVWVTVGARNGDERRVAWFDPLHPDQRPADIAR